MGNIPRMNLHLRLQHGFLTLFFITALGTGLGLGPWQLVVRGFGPDTWYQIHLWSGLGVASLLLYHALYLAVRGYVEGRNWRSFPLRWKKEDWQETLAEIRFLSGRRLGRPEADLYRFTQKALYWGTVVFLLCITITGGVMSLWEHLGGLAPLPLLGQMAQVHRGTSLILLAVLLWHIYGVLVWDGRWEPEWSWLNGGMKGGKAERKVPGFFREFRQREQERLESLKKKSPEAYEEERRRLEKEEVEVELARGNQLAREEKFVEALYHYRRALEKYPGYSQARYNMARVLQKMGERSMALEAYRQFLEADPFHPLARKAQESIRDLERRDYQ